MGRAPLIKLLENGTARKGMWGRWLVHDGRTQGCGRSEVNLGIMLRAAGYWEKLLGGGGKEHDDLNILKNRPLFKWRGEFWAGL